MRRAYHSPVRLLTAIGLTVTLMGLIAFAVEGDSVILALLHMGSTVLLTAGIHWLFPASGFFTLVFCNSISIYTCLFTVFSLVSFSGASLWAAEPAFAMPLMTFFVSAVIRRKQIRSIVESSEHQITRPLRSSTLWILPLVAIGVSAFIVPFDTMEPILQDSFLIGAMGMISVVAAVASRNIVIFLIDTGALFEDFFDMLAHVAKPVFAFFTFYAITVIAFACLYRVVDLATGIPNFLVLGEPTHLDFVQALYFSVVTLSTLGYGDIVPLTLAVKVLVTLEIVCGVLLLLFGFNALWQYTDRHARARRERS